MNLAVGRGRVRVDYRLAAVALIVFFACLFYPIASTFLEFNPGFTMNTSWQVIDVGICAVDPSYCQEHDIPIQIGDQITQIGSLELTEYLEDRNLVPFAGYEVGDIVPVSLLRNGTEMSVEWEIPQLDLAIKLFSVLTPLLIFGPFWLAGTSIILFMQPHNTQWRLLVVFNYLTAFWLASGSDAGIQVLYSQIIVETVAWFMLPVFIHLHLEIPSKITRRSLRIPLGSLYLLSLVIAILELLQLTDQRFYMIALLAATGGSIVILVYRSLFKESSPADTVASRIMLAGVGLAFGPGLTIWLLPALLGIRTPGHIATSVALLAIPILPLFYTYAIYKRRLGVFEVRLNRLISAYAMFITYLLIFFLAFFLGGNLLIPSSQSITFYIMIFLAFALAALPFQERFVRQFNRLTYGSDIDPRDVVSVYSSEIPAAVDRESLEHLLADEILPLLGIHQSTILIKSGDSYHVLYERQVTQKQQPVQGDIKTLIDSAGVYRPGQLYVNNFVDESLNWVRLPLTLSRPGGTIGIWLFGSRDPDDFYSQSDVDLLNRLAKQVAITLDNMRLLEKVQSELAERKRAEEALKNYTNRLELIRTIDQAVLEVNTPTEIAEIALSQLRFLIPYTRGSILIFDLEREEVLLLAISGESPHEATSGLPVSQGLLEKWDLPEQSGIWRLNDISNPPERADIEKGLRMEGMQSVLIAPLIVSGKSIGALNVGSDDPEGFEQVHEDILGEIAGTLAVGIHSAMLFEEVTNHSAALKRLSNRLINVQEDERRQISYALHDEVGQVLTAISYNLAVLRKELPDQVLTAIEERLLDTDDLVRQVAGQIRDMSLRLRPSMLKDLGLVPTLRWYLNQYSNRLDTKVDFRADPLEFRLSDDIETTLYRFVQEALTNVARHANASDVCVSFESHDGLVRAIVEDNGAGFIPDEIVKSEDSMSGIGLLGIRERIDSVRGQLVIVSAPGEGTKLIVEIPLNSIDAKD